MNSRPITCYSALYIFITEENEFLKLISTKAKKNKDLRKSKNIQSVMTCFPPHDKDSELSSVLILFETGFCPNERNFLQKSNKGQSQYISFTPAQGFVIVLNPDDAFLVILAHHDHILFKYGDKLHVLKGNYFDRVFSCNDEKVNIKDALFMSRSGIYINNNSARSGYCIPEGDGNWWRVDFFKDKGDFRKPVYLAVDSKSKATVLHRHKEKYDTKHGWHAEKNVRRYRITFNDFTGRIKFACESIGADISQAYALPSTDKAARFLICAVVIYNHARILLPDASFSYECFLSSF